MVGTRVGVSVGVVVDISVGGGVVEVCVAVWVRKAAAGVTGITVPVSVLDWQAPSAMSAASNTLHDRIEYIASFYL